MPEVKTSHNAKHYRGFIFMLLVISAKPYFAKTDKDLALNKPSWLGPRAAYDAYTARLANDEDDWSTYAVPVPNENETSWWMVDLGAKVYEVTMYIRAYDFEPNILEFIDVFTEDPRHWPGFPDNVNGTVCPHTKSTEAYKDIHVTCGRYDMVRYARISYPVKGFHPYILTFEVYSDLPNPAYLRAFQRINVAKPNGHSAAATHVVSNKIDCARRMIRQNYVDGFEWNPVTKLCSSYTDAESLRESMENEGPETILHHLFMALI